MTKSNKKIVAVLDELADFLMTDSVSIRKLKGFRDRLKLDDDSFASLLGIKTTTLQAWNRRSAVPRQGREKLNRKVVEALKSVMGGANIRAVSLASNRGQKTALNPGFEGSLSTPLPFPGDFWSFRPFVIPDYGKSLGIVKSVTTPETITNNNSLHYWTPLDKRTLANERKFAKDRLTAQIRQKHAPQPGDSYINCECSICL